MIVSVDKDSPHYAEWAMRADIQIFLNGDDITNRGVVFADEENGIVHHNKSMDEDDNFVATNPDGSIRPRITAGKVEIKYPEEMKWIVEQWKNDKESRDTGVEPSKQNQG